jgi:hypothetical protein
MSDRRRMLRQAALPAAVALVAAAAGFALAASAQPTSASWVAAKAVGITATAVTPAAVPTVACGAANGLLSGSIPITWTAPSGTTPSRYRLVWTGTAGSGQAYFTASPGSVTGSTLSVLGTATVTVYPEYGDWISTPASLQTRTVTTVSVAGAIVAWSCA